MAGMIFVTREGYHLRKVGMVNREEGRLEKGIDRMSSYKENQLGMNVKLISG